MELDTNTKWVSCFNSRLDEFLKDLISSYPNDKDFLMFKQSFNMIKLVDDSKPAYLFKIYTMRYVDQIYKNDEKFFLDHDFKDELTSSDNNNFSSEMLVKLKSYWKTMSDENKAVIWKYLNLLCKINIKIQ
jgi:hypothetical protein|uniref:Uncharacterized protein n=1 Tax=viral metagenome TaxID=1070528 RepID=A0A6C0BP45_9ZZZZ